jgi:hypothetical protein
MFDYPNILTRYFTNNILDRIHLPISSFSGVSFLVVVPYSTFGFPNETGCVLDGGFSKYTA